MLGRTKWRVVEELCPRGEAERCWASARDRGAVGAVTSWGAGMTGRETIRLYWELRGGEARVPAGEDLVEENWTPHWRESFRTTPVTRHICLVPAWEEPPADAMCSLRIDPGMAFGAGDHPTTQLCLRLMEEYGRSGGLPERFLDVDAGAGVLALAAVCLGSARADALDIDPFGYAACRRNATLNGLENRVRPVLLSLDLVEPCYPLVVANLVTNQLERLAPLLRARVEPGGELLLSGFESGAEARVVEAVGWPVRKRRSEDGWVALALRAPG